MAEFQPPEGLRKVALKAINEFIDGWNGELDYAGGAADAVLDALFEACTVRERWYVKHLNKHGRSNWMRIFNHYAEAVEVEAMNRDMAERDGDRSVLLQKIELHWTQPSLLSSTGEESSDG